MLAKRMRVTLRKGALPRAEAVSLCEGPHVNFNVCVRAVANYYNGKRARLHIRKYIYTRTHV